MNKDFNFRGEHEIVLRGGDNRANIRLYACSLGVTGEQLTELEAMFDALSATIDGFIDENAENIEKIFPETTED